MSFWEWGGRFHPADNTRQEMEMVRKYYVDSGGFQTASQDMTLAFAKGGRFHQCLYSVTFPGPGFGAGKKWNVLGIESRDMAPPHGKIYAGKQCFLSAFGKNQPNNRVLFAEACEKLGWSHGQPPNIRDRRGLNTCNMGCLHQAKQEQQ
ncbi:MAG: hypothetical protein R2941_12045 [Desulfobacterales bacterium]